MSDMELPWRFRERRFGRVLNIFRSSSVRPLSVKSKTAIDDAHGSDLSASAVVFNGMGEPSTLRYTKLLNSRSRLGAALVTFVDLRFRY